MLRDKALDVYRTELEVHEPHESASERRCLPEHRLGENYFRLFALEYEAPLVCSNGIRHVLVQLCLGRFLGGTPEVYNPMRGRLCACE